VKDKLLFGFHGKDQGDRENDKNTRGAAHCEIFNNEGSTSRESILFELEDIFVPILFLFLN
jgi:hypothetical protein